MKMRPNGGEAAVERLRAYFVGSDDLLRAITRGEVDAIVLPGPQDEQVFTLKGAERSHRILLENMNEGAATVNAAGTISYCNKRFAEMLRAPHEQVMGSMLHAWIPDAEQPTFAAMLQVGCERGMRRETSLSARDGEELPIYLSVNLLDTDEGTTLCLVATDLSQQKRDQEMVASDRLTRSVLEQAAESIVVCDKQGIVVRASAAAHRLCGGNPLLRAFRDAYGLQIDAKILDDALWGKLIRGVVAQLQQGAAANSTVMFSAGPLLGPNRALLGSIITMTDVTELQNVQGRLEAAVQARDEFLSVASHELRTPVTALQLHLQGIARILERGAADVVERVGKKIEAAVKQTWRLESLIGGLLDVTRLAEGHLGLEIEKLDLAEVVADVVDRCQDSAARVGCVLQIKKSVVSQGYWDRLRLEQVLINLFTNAIKYAPGKPIQVYIECDAKNAWISIEDQGIGIADEDLERIFGRFERAASKRHYGGLGLGLYITQQIVNALRGSISVESKVGQGSTFKVMLPKGEGEMTTFAQPPAESLSVKH